MAQVIIYKQARKKFQTIYLIINNNGIERWENTGLKLYGTGNDKNTIKQAEVLRAKRMIEIVEGKYDVVPVNYDMSFVGYYKKLIDSVPEYERRLALYQHLLDFSPNLKFKDVNETWWMNFKKYLQTKKRPYQQNTIHLALVFLKHSLKRAVRENIINKNPLQFIIEKKTESTAEYLTLEELQLLEKTPCENENIKKFFLFGCLHGQRRGDQQRMTKKNIVEGHLVFYTEKSKFRKLAKVPLHPSAYEYLPDFFNLKDDDLLFNLPSWSSIYPRLKSWVWNAGIHKKVTPHTSRHTYATLLLTYGGSLEQVKELLQHSDFKMTQIYAKMIDKKKIEAVNNIPAIRPPLRLVEKF